MSNPPAVRFAAIGLNHNHIYGQTNLLLNAGADLVAYHAPEADLAAEYSHRFPQARRASSPETILEDESIQLVITAAIPNQRAKLAISAMHHGKDVMSDKPGLTTLEQLEEVRKVQQATGRIFSICYSERFENRATTKAGELVKGGAIGTVVQTVGFGPHLARFSSRPDWFYDRQLYGGILADIGAHQCDQFLYFTGATSAQIVGAQVANYHHPQYSGWEEFGDAIVRAPHCSGYFRVDWFTPDGLGSWGDTRLTVIGTDGYIEVRKNIDIAGRSGANHLFMVNHHETAYIDCSDVELPYGRQLLDDIVNRTETAMSQDHCFRAMELALQAQAQAAQLGNLATA